MSYTIYAVEHCPQAMLAKYPTPAIYAEGKLYLFGENLQQVTGIEAPKVIDIESMELTNEQLDAYVDELLLMLGEGEVKLSISQGRYLYDTRFKPKGGAI